MPIFYQHITPNGDLPKINNKQPNLSIIIADLPVSDAFMSKIATLIVESGCLYCMAWGKQGRFWDDAVDMANLEKFNFGDIPKDQFITTTWHENDTLKEVFHLSQIFPFHESIKLQQIQLLHIAREADEKRIIDLFHESRPKSTRF